MIRSQSATLALLLLAGCAGSSGPSSPGSRVDLLGFTRSQAAVLRWDGSQQAALETITLPFGPTRTLGTVGARNVEEARWWAQELAAVHGWIPAEPVEAIGDVHIELAIARRVSGRPEAAIVARIDDQRTVVRGLGVGAGASVEVGGIWAAPDDRHAVVAIDQNGHRSLHIVDVRRARASILNDTALVAYRRGDMTEASILWERATTADPGFGDALYNLACVHARAGNLRRAQEELALAIAIDPVRYRRLARDDPDLDVLRSDHRIRQLIGLPVAAVDRDGD